MKMFQPRINQKNLVFFFYDSRENTLEDAMNSMTIYMN